MWLLHPAYKGLLVGFIVLLGPINGTPLNMRSEDWPVYQNIETTTTRKSKGVFTRDWKGSTAAITKVDILKKYAIPRLIYLADQANVKVTYPENLDLMTWTSVKEWLHLPPSTHYVILHFSTWDKGLGITRLLGLIPRVQARRLHRIMQSSDETRKTVAWQEGIEKEFERLWRR